MTWSDVDRSDALVQDALDRLVRDVADFPSPGIVFKDITPLLADPTAFAAVVEALARAGRAGDGTPAIDKVAGIEARGFILAAPIALALGVGFVPVRKAGKLPGPVHRADYTLEYADSVVELHRDALEPGERVLLVDDVLATGGTAAAAVDLIRAASAEVVGMAVLLELGPLEGRRALPDVPLTVLRRTE